MAILCLNGVELVSQGQVVLVSLLDLKNLSLQLRDQQVLLVACQMHAVVVLLHESPTRLTNLLVRKDLFLDGNKKWVSPEFEFVILVLKLVWGVLFHFCNA